MVTGGALRLVFFGTPEFAVPTLDALVRSRHPVAAVVTQPDRPRGRGHRTTEAPVKVYASAHGIPVLQPERLKDAAFVEALAAIGADLGIVAAYGRILTDDVLTTPRLGLLNVHASLLPRYRGAAPINRAIIAGERETGVTIMRVVKALDAGPMLAAVRRPIGPDETSDDVERALAKLGAGLLASTVDALAGGHVIETPQHDADATYAPRLTKEDGAIDWTQPAERIHAYSFLNGQRLILKRSALAAGATGAPGAVLDAHGDRLVVAAGSGAIAIVELQAEGRRPMSPREFLAGHHIAPGDRFSISP
jgi:methionyl-tRNA formyltransferase